MGKGERKKKRGALSALPRLQEFHTVMLQPKLHLILQSRFNRPSEVVNPRTPTPVLPKPTSAGAPPLLQHEYLEDESQGRVVLPRLGSGLPQEVAG